jgi:Carbon-nitrogen hydrolase
MPSPSRPKRYPDSGRSRLARLNWIGMALPLLVAMLAPVWAQAGDVVLSDVTLTARATFSSQRVTPEKSDFDVKTAPADQLLQAAQALVIEGLPFPNQPNSQNAGFASSAATVGGVFGVGVIGFHFENSLPPNRYFASGRWTQTLTNDSAVTQVSSATISVPAPTIRFFGVGNSFPSGANADLDATASVDIRLTTKLTHADGSVVETVPKADRVGYGDSYIVDPYGEIVARARQFEEDIVFADLNLALARNNQMKIGRSLWSQREFGKILTDVALSTCA